MELPVWMIVVLTILGLVALKILFLLVLCQGSFSRLFTGISLFFKSLTDSDFTEKVNLILNPPPPPPPPKRSGEALRLLSLLQRDSRVLDFFLEEISTASDDQIGAAVRELHKKAQKVLKEHLVLEPIVSGNEGEMVNIPSGFDPSAIRVIGNVTGKPPFKGQLIHKGWRVKDFNLPAPHSSIDEFVVAPAEVELP